MLMLTLPRCSSLAVPQAGPSKWLEPRPTRFAPSRCGCARPLAGAAPGGCLLADRALA